MDRSTQIPLPLSRERIKVGETCPCCKVGEIGFRSPQARMGACGHCYQRFAPTEAE